MIRINSLSQLTAKELARMTESLERRSCPEALTGCFLWHGLSDPHGYGDMRTRRKPTQLRISAHRFAWMLQNGDIPKGMLVRHRCDVPSCVNPDHLLVGTCGDNVRDMLDRGRHVPRRKLTVEQVRLIRSLLGTMSYSKIAKQVGISITQVFSIKHGREWKGVT